MRFLKNLTLSGWDVAQLATAFLPVPARMLANPLLRTAVIGGKVVVTGLTEAGEEAIQEAFIQQARGEPVELNQNMKLAMLLGGVMGAGMGATGAAFTTIVDRTAENLPPDMKTQFDKDVTEGIENGLTQEQAIVVALDNVVQTPEGKKIIEDVVQEVQKEDAELQIQASKDRLAGIKKIIREERGAIGEEEIVPEELVTPEVVPGVEPTAEEVFALWNRNLARWRTNRALAQKFIDENIRPAIFRKFGATPLLKYFPSSTTFKRIVKPFLSPSKLIEYSFSVSSSTKLNSTLS